MRRQQPEGSLGLLVSMMTHHACLFLMLQLMHARVPDHHQYLASLRAPYLLSLIRLDLHCTEYVMHNLRAISWPQQLLGISLWPLGLDSAILPTLRFVALRGESAPGCTTSVGRASQFSALPVKQSPLSYNCLNLAYFTILYGAKYDLRQTKCTTT